MPPAKEAGGADAEAGAGGGGDAVGPFAVGGGSNGSSAGDPSQHSGGDSGGDAGSEGVDWRIQLGDMTDATIKSFTPQGIKRVSTFSERSLFVFTKGNPVRVAAMRAIVSKLFDNAILLLILLNCITLAMGSNAPNFESSRLGKFLAVSEWVFTPLFVIEMMLKVLGMGFFLGKGAYLRDPWNVMDFLVVLLGIIASSGLIGNYTSIRTVRVLRPLRTLTSVEGLRKLVVTLMSSLPMLGNVLLLCGFLFFILGIVGIQSFAERMRNRCGYEGFDTATGLLTYVLEDPEGDLCSGPMYPMPLEMGDYEERDLAALYAQHPHLCSEEALAYAGGAGGACEWLEVIKAAGGEAKDVEAAREAQWDLLKDAGVVEGPWEGLDEWGKASYSGRSGAGRVCPRDGDGVQLTCVRGENPKHNVISFDNILWAWLTIFTCVSMEGWTDVMYDLQDGKSPWVWIYFVFLIVVGSFYAINLALAVLYLYFTRRDDDEEAESAQDDAGDKKVTSDAKAFDNGGHMPGDVPVQSSSKLVRTCQSIVEHESFMYVIVALIVINTIVMAAEFDGMPDVMFTAFDAINYILTAAFAVEMVLKITALGPGGYRKDPMNVFDGVIVVLSIVEIIVTLASGSGGGGMFSVLRAFRLLRVFKLARSWKELNSIITTVFRSVASVTYLSLILVLFIFVFALLGMQLFGYRYEFCDDGGQMCPPGGAVQGVPAFLSGGGKCSDHRECYASVDDAGVACASKFDCTFGLATEACDVFLAGDIYAGLNTQQRATVTFSPDVASLVSDRRADGVDGCMMFAGEKDGDGDVFEIAAMRYVGRPYRPRHNFDDVYWSIITIFQVLTGENWNEVMYDGMYATSDALALYFLLLFSIGNYIILNLFLAILLDNFAADDDDEDEDEDDVKGEDEEDAKLASSEVSKASPSAKGDANSIPRSQSFSDKPGGPSLRRLLSESNASNASQTERSIDELLSSLVPEANSLFVFPPDNAVRVACARVVSHNKFELGIIAAILISSMLLALDSNALLNDNSSSGKALRAALFGLDVLFVALFAVEMVLKVITMGFVAHKDAYLRNGWNVLDFLIVIVGIVGLAASGGALDALRALRTFRALRPLRMASRATGIKVIVNALFKAIPAIGNVLLVCALFYLIFGILGLNLLLGRLRYCGFDCGDDIWHVAQINGMSLPDSFGKCGESLEVDDFPMLGPRAGKLDVPAALYPPGFVDADGGPLGLQPMELDKDFCEIPSMPNVAPFTDLPEFAGSKYYALAWWAQNGFEVRSGVACAPDAEGREKASCIVHTDMVAARALFEVAFGDDADGFAAAWALWTDSDVNAVESPAAAAMVTHAASLDYYNLPTSWNNRDKHFDNIFASILTLFEMATLEMFLDTMYQGIDSTGSTTQPIRDTNPALALYFVSFIIIGSFFVMNLFVGVTIDKFNEMKHKSDDGVSVFLSSEQQAWVNIQRIISGVKPLVRLSPPDGEWRARTFHVVQSDAFDGFIMSCIMANIVFMSMRTADMTDEWVAVLFWANFVFTTIFFLEMVFKIWALGPRNYFGNPWNKFDFVVVQFSIVGLCLDAFTGGGIPVVSLLRVFRVARIFRLVPRAKGLKTLFHTLLFSLPALVNVGSVLLLFFFIYSIMGMNLFGSVRYGENLNRYANFRDFPAAMMTLFRMATGESWNGIMWDAMVTQECHSLSEAYYQLDYTMPQVSGDGTIVDVDMVLSPLKCPVDALFPRGIAQQATSAVASFASAAAVNAALEVKYGADAPPTCEPYDDDDTGLRWLRLTLADGTICERVDQTAEEVYFDSSSPCIQMAREWYGSRAVENRCTPWEGAAILYFSSFVVVCALIVLNLVIGVILDEIIASSDAETLPVVPAHMDRFIEVWQELDTEGSYFIKRRLLPKLITRLEPPLGIRGTGVSSSTLMSMLRHLDISVHNGKINFHETLYSLAARVAAHPLPTTVEQEVRIKILKKLDYFKVSAQAETEYTAGHYHAAEYVQAAVRGFLTRYKVHTTQAERGGVEARGGALEVVDAENANALAPDGEVAARLAEEAARAQAARAEDVLAAAPATPSGVLPTLDNR